MNFSTSYRNYHPVAYPPTDMNEPVPGWGMTAIMAGPPRLFVDSIGCCPETVPKSIGGLGYDMVIKTPFGDQKISVPIEDAMKKGVAAALPDMAKAMESEMTDTFVNKVWPKIQPKLRTELQASVNSARDEMKRDVTIAAVAVVAAIGVVAFMVRKR